MPRAGAAQSHLLRALSHLLRAFTLFIFHIFDNHDLAAHTRRASGRIAV